MSQDRIAIADPEMGESEREQVLSILENGRLADGPVVREFEAEFAEYCGATHGVATANGTAALHTALAAAGIDDGDAVITTPFSFVASANAIQFCGATPVFADIDPETYTLDPDVVEAAIEERDDVVGILAVHLFGLPAEMDRLVELADEHDLMLIEDAAQAHGASYDGDAAGTIGDVGCFSFYPTKNMTTGEGGMVVTDDAELAERAAQFVNHGRADTGAHGYEHVEVGYNYRMTSLAAGIGLAQLDKLPQYNACRRTNAARLSNHLAPITELDLPTEPSAARHVYHQYTVRCRDRAALREHLDACGIDTAVYYPTIIPDQPAYDGVDPDVSIARRAADEVVSLPIHPGVDAAGVTRIGEAVHEHYSDAVPEGETVD
jgi:dTDP-4-amino-4,6-dideoxygalactose transaminase